MRLGDYADGTWMFIATYDTRGRQARVNPAKVLTHPRTCASRIPHSLAESRIEVTLRVA